MHEYNSTILLSHHVEGRGPAAIGAPHDPLLLHGKELSLSGCQLVLVQPTVVCLHWVWAPGLNNVLHLMLGLRKLLAGIHYTGVICHELIHLLGHLTALGPLTWHCRCPLGAAYASTVGSVGEEESASTV